MKLICFRYMWLCEGSDNLNIKILVDIEKGHEKFIETLKALPDIRSLVRVYQYEIDAEKIESFVSLINKKKAGEE